jgi:hypothetical protein
VALLLDQETVDLATLRTLLAETAGGTAADGTAAPRWTGSP